jgi:hypothetical protein
MSRTGVNFCARTEEETIDEKNKKNGEKERKKL